MTKKTVSVRQAAKQLGFTMKYVYDLLYSGRLAGEKVGRQWRGTEGQDTAAGGR